MEKQNKLNIKNVFHMIIITTLKQMLLNTDLSATHIL